jgi:hypothetical protein
VSRELFSGMMFAPLALRIVTAHIRARTILATAMVLSAVFCLGFSILCPLQRALAQEHPAQRLHDEKANKYRGGDSVPSHFSGELINKTVDPQEAITVELNMRKLFKKLLVVAGSESDKYYSPHLRDILIDIPSRAWHAWVRANAGIRRSWFSCKGACWYCKWIDLHRASACCRGSTSAYGPLVLDHNFKTCCVRSGEENWSEEKIACSHPSGDGWAGLFEFYFPTTVIGWENDRSTTMIVEKGKVSECLQQADPIMQSDDARKWVADAISRNLSSVGGPVPIPGREESIRDEVTREIDANVQGVIKDVRPKDQKLRFADSLQGQGLTMRVNFATMNPWERRALAVQFCMHPDQFMKIMNTEEDEFQKPPPGGGNTFGMLQNIPVFANYCGNGARLMISPWESANLAPVDGTPTDLAKGFLAGYLGAGPMYCQAMAARYDGSLTEEQRQIILQSGTAALDEKDVGYSCRNNGKSTVALSPLSLYRAAQVERRTPEHALAFAIAGGLFEKDTHDTTKPSYRKSYYKRFEPMPYSQRAGIFSGKKFDGGLPGLVTEQNLPCIRPLKGENHQGQNKSDQWYISDSTHNFTQENVSDWNKTWKEWTTDGNTPKRGLDDRSQNYAAMSRIFASCPAGYKQWKGDHSGDTHRACGSEKLW